MAKDGVPVTSGPFPLTYKSITLKMDDRMLGELLRSRTVRLRAFCLEDAAGMELLLENPNAARARGQDTLEIETDRETMIGMVSPTMKVVFQGDSYSAEFDTKDIGGRPLFSSPKPMTEGISRKD